MELHANIGELLAQLTSGVRDNSPLGAFAVPVSQKGPAGSTSPSTDSRSLVDISREFAARAARSSKRNAGVAYHERTSPDSFLQSLEQAQLLVQAPSCPIVAVLGLLNAGKSSLVSTFLDDQVPSVGRSLDGVTTTDVRTGSQATASSRDRVLIGSSNAEGTHRFVLWVPQSWKSDSTIWGFVQSQLAQVFGCEAELLADDPTRASEQYNDTAPRTYIADDGQTIQRATIEIPLIATDPKLDHWGIALMDCPDVQTGLLPGNTIPTSSHLQSEVVGAAHATLEPRAAAIQSYADRVQSIADARLAVLSRSASLCSAFIVVLPANAMHEKTVSQLLSILDQRMPHVQRFIAVNRVPRKYTSIEIAKEIQTLYGHLGVTRRYMAYNFEGPQQRDKIPAPPDSFSMPADLNLPLFFRIDDSPPPQPPAPIAAEQWLLHVGQQLEKRSLLKDGLDSIVANLINQIRASIASLRTRVDDDQRIGLKLQQSIADACLQFSLDPTSSSSNPKVRLQASRQIIDQIAKSLERTSPWWAQPGRWTIRVAEYGRSGISNATNWIQLPSWFTGKTAAMGQWIRSRFTQGQSGKIVTADSLVDYLAQHDRVGHLQLDDDESQRDKVLRACQHAIDRFQSENRSQLNKEELDRITSRMWQDMPMSKRLLTGFAPAGIVFAPLLAVLMIPMDFGGSAVLVLASLKELLFAGAAGVGLLLTRSDEMPQLAESEAAWQQLGDLFAILCDEIGIERPISGQSPSVQIENQKRQIPISQLPLRATSLSSDDRVIPTRYVINEVTCTRIENILATLANSIRR